MQAQQQAVVASQAAEGLIELDLAMLAHVGGGTPKGTWNEADAPVATATQDDGTGVEPTPKGTW